jgi:hypothetical protein
MVVGIRANDGLALVALGDVVVILWKAPARLHYAIWLYDALDEIVASKRRQLSCMQVILSSSSPPDEATRAETFRRLKTLMPWTRRLVTVPVGDSFWASIVRSVMRMTTLTFAHTRTHFICDTVEEGIGRLIEVATPLTPSAEELNAAVLALADTLAVDTAGWVAGGEGVA